jgi:hypothetical protein
MKNLHFNFGWCEIDLNFRSAATRPLEIRKYDPVPRKVLPEIRRLLYSRLKAGQTLPNA